MATFHLANQRSRWIYHHIVYTRPVLSDLHNCLEGLAAGLKSIPNPHPWPQPLDSADLSDLSNVVEAPPLHYLYLPRPDRSANIKGLGPRGMRRELQELPR